VAGRFSLIEEWPEAGLHPFPFLLASERGCRLTEGGEAHSPLIGR